MAHPKRRHSKARRDKRRTHDHIDPKTLTTDATTAEVHVMHRAHLHEGNLYYRGRVLVENYKA